MRKMGYDREVGPSCESKMPANMPVKDRLLGEKRNLEQRISNIDRALELYAKNPDVEELTNILGRIHI